jgi:hypothetical protein
MMTMPRRSALITSRDPKGLQAVSIFESAYNQSHLNDVQAQRLNEQGDELKEGVEQFIYDIVRGGLPRAGQKWYVRYPHSPHVARVLIRRISHNVVELKECGFGPDYTFRRKEVDFLERFI